MSETWPLHEARAQLSKVIAAAQVAGAQVITRRGKPVAVIVSRYDYERLTQTDTNLIEFFRNSPLVGVELDLERSRE
jgi:prevent-host-death family protein